MWTIFQAPKSASSCARQSSSTRRIDYGRRVAEGLELDVKEVERLAEMPHDERAKATEK